MNDAEIFERLVNVAMAAGVKKIFLKMGQRSYRMKNRKVDLVT